MGEPVPGTIVSVLQDAAGAAEHAAADPADFAEVVSAAADAAAVALDKTTGQLDVLAEAGVVDAGGRSLLVLLDAMSTTLTGRAPHRHEYLPSPPSTAPPRPSPLRRSSSDVPAGGCDAGGGDARSAWTNWANRWHRRVGGRRAHPYTYSR
jgi:dihydroxyacetone kinase-like predicted kinase